MFRKGQTVFQDFVIFLFVILGVMVVGIFASATTPFLSLMVSSNNITGGMGLVAEYFNVILVMVLLFVTLILVFVGGGGQ